MKFKELVNFRKIPELGGDRLVFTLPFANKILPVVIKYYTKSSFHDISSLAL